MKVEKSLRWESPGKFEKFKPARGNDALIKDFAFSVLSPLFLFIGLSGIISIYSASFCALALLCHNLILIDWR